MAKEYEVIRDAQTGKVSCVVLKGDRGSVFGPGSNMWAEFLIEQGELPVEQRADLSDKEPVIQSDPEAPVQQSLIDYLKVDPVSVTQPQREIALRALIRLVLRHENRLQDVD